MLFCVLLASCASNNRIQNDKPTFDLFFSNKAEKQVSAAYWNTSLSDAKRLARTQECLLSFVNSSSVDDRRGAAWVSGELGHALDSTFVRRVFETQLTDPDPGVRFIALMECTTCTGYSEKFLVGSTHKIKTLRRDPEPQIRQYARAVHFLAVKAARYN